MATERTRRALAFAAVLGAVFFGAIKIGAIIRPQVYGLLLAASGKVDAPAMGAGGPLRPDSREPEDYRFPVLAADRPKASSGFGRRLHPVLHRLEFHEGMDFPESFGTPVFPARSGSVVQAGWLDGYGKMVAIHHPDGSTTRYGHLSSIAVSIGAEVDGGRTLIGSVGSTGLSTGPHLHFELIDKNGKALNPDGLLVPD
ncbi:MAG: M23 family metallopeptidase [Elusimicrobia bacterium]|nr:M23 family metallopeptidase [Elusimicrobiota bacterium]